jgi:hypothetical protein
MCVWWADVASSTCAAGVPTAGTSGASRDGAPGVQSIGPRAARYFGAFVTGPTRVKLETPIFQASPRRSYT